MVHTAVDWQLSTTNSCQRQPKMCRQQHLVARHRVCFCTVRKVDLCSLQAHFWLPLNLLGFIPCDYIKYSRFGVWLSTHPYPSSYPSLPRITQLIHRIMTPVKHAIWKSMGMLLPWQSGYACYGSLPMHAHICIYLLQHDICEAHVLRSMCLLWWISRVLARPESLK